MTLGRAGLGVTVLLLLGAATEAHHSHGSWPMKRKCLSPLGPVGTCQTLKSCGFTNAYAIVRAMKTRLCYWSQGQPYFCCPSSGRDASSQRHHWFALTSGTTSTFNAGKTPTTAASLPETSTTVRPTESTSRPYTYTTVPTTLPTVQATLSTIQTTLPPTLQTTPSTVRTQSPVDAATGGSVLDSQSRIGAGAAIVPSKRLSPPPPPAGTSDGGLVGGEKAAVPMEGVKDMPTVEPFPMEPKEEESKDGAAAPGDIASICGRSDPVVVADANSADILREAFPEVTPVFAVPEGLFGKEARVAGGFASVQGRWPWMVMLGKMDGSNVTWLCGGSIIDEYHVLTAAHCVLERPNVVRVGGHNMELTFRIGDNSEQHEIAKLTLHPKYRPPRSYHDLAIVTLKRALLFSRFVRPICLPSPDLRLRRGMTAKITGHGYQEFNGGMLSARLQEAQIQVVRRKICNASYSRLGRAFFDKYPNGVLSHMICAGDKKGGVDACQGDSGGPLVLHNDVTGTYHQIGVISSGFGCGNPEYPGLYVSVRHHLDFISAVTRSHWSRASVDLTEPVRPRSVTTVAPPVGGERQR